MQDMTMKLSLIELYDLVGDDMGISFLYEELPGVVVTIGFTREEALEAEEENDNDDGNDEGSDDDGLDVQPARKGKPKLH